MTGVERVIHITDIDALIVVHTRAGSALLQAGIVDIAVDLARGAGGDRGGDADTLAVQPTRVGAAGSEATVLRAENHICSASGRDIGGSQNTLIGGAVPAVVGAVLSAIRCGQTSILSGVNRSGRANRGRGRDNGRVASATAAAL